MSRKTTSLVAVPMSIGRALRISVLILGIVGVVPLLLQSASADDAKPPIKIGVLIPETGFLSFYMDYVKSGLALALDEVGNKVGGRSIELIMEDDATDPNVALTKVRKLIERDKVDVVLGPVSSANCLALLDYMRQAGTPWVVSNCSVNRLTQGDVPANLFRPSYSDAQLSYAPGKYLVSNLGHRRVILVGLDYAGGLDTVAAFAKGVTDAGGEVTTTILLPPGTSDHAPYVAKALDAAPNADAIVLLLWGSDSIGFLKGLREYGLQGKLPTMGIGGFADSYFLSQPDIAEAAVGMFTYNEYSTQIDTPENERFWKAYIAKTNTSPSDDAYVGYLGARVVIEALKSVDGNVEDKAALLKAFENVSFAAPAGQFQFDKKHNVIFDLYLQQIQENEGKVVPVLLNVIERRVAQPAE